MLFVFFIFFLNAFAALSPVYVWPILNVHSAEIIVMFIIKLSKFNSVYFMHEIKMIDDRKIRIHCS